MIDDPPPRPLPPRTSPAPPLNLTKIAACLPGTDSRGGVRGIINHDRNTEEMEVFGLLYFVTLPMGQKVPKMHDMKTTGYYARHEDNLRRHEDR